MKRNKLCMWLILCCFFNGCSTIPHHLKTPQQLKEEQEVAQALLNLAFVGGVIYYAHKQDQKDRGAGRYSSSTPSTPACQYTENFQGCCSWHDGVLGCYDYQVICNDGIVSPTCGPCSVPYCLKYR